MSVCECVCEYVCVSVCVFVCVYVACITYTVRLILMVNFVINVYAKAWFSIKTKSLFTDSPTHVFNMVQNAVQLDDSRVSEVIFRVIENNSLALRSENLLCAMSADFRPNIRSQAIEKILDIRKNSVLVTLGNLLNLQTSISRPMTTMS